MEKKIPVPLISESLIMMIMMMMMMIRKINYILLILFKYLSLCEEEINFYAF
jgi:hypothetical protein